MDVFWAAGARRRRRRPARLPPARGRRAAAVPLADDRRGPRPAPSAASTGESHQALLCLGALPETVSFPGRGAELLFAPLEAAGFPVDAAFSARWVPNDAATRLVRRRVVDADNEETEQLAGDHGPSPEAAKRPLAARALEDYLTGEAHPPMLRATISLAVGAPSAEERERRVETLRREYAPITLERPTGDQLRLFCQHFPGQPTQLADYEDYLLVEQLGAMVPDRHARRRRRRRPLPRPHPVRVAGAGLLRRHRGLPVLVHARDPDRRPARAAARSVVAAAPALRALPAGVEGHRRRPQARPPLDRARGRSRRTPR